MQPGGGRRVVASHTAIAGWCSRFRERPHNQGARPRIEPGEMVACARTASGGYLGWVTELVDVQAADLVRVSREMGLGGEEAFGCVEEALQAFLALPQARALLARPEDAREILATLTRSFARGRRHPSSPPPKAGDRPCEPHEPAEPAGPLMEQAEQLAVLLGGINLLPQVQRLVITLRLLEAGTSVTQPLGLSADTAAWLRRRACGHLKLCLAEGEALVAAAEGPRRLLSERPLPARGSRVIRLDEQGFEREVLGAERPVVIHFVADWCKPCHSMSPLLEQMAEEQQGSLVVAELDVERCPAVTARYRVRALPTLVVFCRGEAVGSSVGSISGPRLSLWVGEVLGSLERRPG